MVHINYILPSIHFCLNLILAGDNLAVKPPAPVILPFTWAILAIPLAYLIGSIPMGLIVARLAGGIDIREHGSGNIGLTNVIRTLGWGPGLITGVLDFLKGYLPMFIVMNSFTVEDFGNVKAVYEIIVIFVALLLILGNLYPVYLLFKGGKGVATGLGVMSALMGPFIFIPLAIFGLLLLLFRYVSVGSMGAAISIPLTVLFLHAHIGFTKDSPTAFGFLEFFSIAVALLILWKHRANIKRIFAGTEPRTGGPKMSPRLAASFSHREPGESKGGDASDSTPTPPVIDNSRPANREDESTRK